MNTEIRPKGFTNDPIDTKYCIDHDGQNMQIRKIVKGAHRATVTIFSPVPTDQVPHWAIKCEQEGKPDFESDWLPGEIAIAFCEGRNVTAKNKAGFTGQFTRQMDAEYAEEGLFARFDNKLLLIDREDSFNTLSIELNSIIGFFVFNTLKDLSLGHEPILH